MGQARAGHQPGYIQGVLADPMRPGASRPRVSRLKLRCWRGRATLGNNQDTSKVLRKLVGDGLVRRRGSGGRRVPFLYQVGLRSQAAVAGCGACRLLVPAPEPR